LFIGSSLFVASGAGFKLDGASCWLVASLMLCARHGLGQNANARQQNASAWLRYGLTLRYGTLGSFLLQPVSSNCSLLLMGKHRAKSVIRRINS
jgi:hypothetical protein